MIRLPRFLLLIAGVLALAGLANASLLATHRALAESLYQSDSPTPTPTGSLPEQKSIADETCLSCHATPGLVLKLENGENLNLSIDADVYYLSIHGKLGYACVQCHTTVGNYPHPPFSAQDARDASLQLYRACRFCHSGQYELVQDSAHAQALQAGNRNAAICTDCHTSHAVRRLNDPATKELLPDARLWIPQTCAKCHNAIYQKYLTSVHGSALIDEGNTDVPTCIDCHGVHNIEDPRTAAFRLRSPEICAKCHTDPEIMNKYGISTDVLDTYVADFHGTTVTLFEKETPDAQVNKPVCYDCHGVHDIVRPDDPVNGLMVKENLLARCRECHTQAPENFPSAWLSHYIPSPEHYPLVYYVNQFYAIFIPTLLGGMAILVVLDFGRRTIPRFRRTTLEAAPEGMEETVIAIPAESLSESTQGNVEALPEQSTLAESPESPLIQVTPPEGSGTDEAEAERQAGLLREEPASPEISEPSASTQVKEAQPPEVSPDSEDKDSSETPTEPNDQVQAEQSDETDREPPHG